MEAPLTILALDLGRNIGWCEGPVGGIPRMGTTRLDARDADDRFIALADWVTDRLSMPNGPTEVVVEAPLVRGDFQGAEAGLQLIGYFTMVRYATRLAERRLTYEFVATARKSVIGRGTFRRNTAKSEVAAWCIAQGWAPPSDDAADALILWLHAHKIRAPGLPLPSPLTGGVFELPPAQSRDPARRNGWIIPSGGRR